MSNGDIFDLKASRNYSQGAIRFRDVQRGHIQFEALFARSDPITRCPTRTCSIEDQPEPFASPRAIGESRNSPTNGKRKAREQGQDSLLDIWSHAGRESRAEQFVSITVVLFSYKAYFFPQGRFFFLCLGVFNETTTRTRGYSHRQFLTRTTMIRCRLRGLRGRRPLRGG